MNSNPDDPRPPWRVGIGIVLGLLGAVATVKGLSGNATGLGFIAIACLVASAGVISQGYRLRLRLGRRGWQVLERIQPDQRRTTGPVALAFFLLFVFFAVIA